MKEFIVNADLYVEDDDADGALAIADTILRDAGGIDLFAEQGCTFGFALGPVRDSVVIVNDSGIPEDHTGDESSRDEEGHGLTFGEKPELPEIEGHLYALIDDREDDLPSAYGPFVSEDAAETAGADLIEACEADSPFPDEVRVFVVRLINPDPYMANDIVTILMRHGL